MKQYKIGEIARLLGLTTQAIRFYEQEGVIVPKKSESGTRYFTTADIIRLLAFKKYRLSEFSVQDVATHFKQGSLNDLLFHLDAQSDALIRQSDMLLRRARALRSLERTLREAQAHVGELACVQRPEVFLQNLTFNQLSDMSAAQRAAFTAFVNAMPETSMYFLCSSDAGIEPEFRFGVGRREAAEWGIPLDGAMGIPPMRCVRAYVRTEGYAWEESNLQPLLARMREAGYTPDPAHPVLGQHLASETVGRTVYLYAVVWIPVLA